MKLEVVICHFQENLDWLTQLKHPFVVYNKNPNEDHLYEYNLSNCGFDTYTYLTYIINNYHNLPDYVCFAQDYPFDHCLNFIDLVNNFDFKSDWHQLGLCHVRTPTGYFKDGYDEKLCHLGQTLEFAKKFNIEVSLPLKFISSAQCIVSKHLILKRSLEFYQNIKNEFPTNVYLSNMNFFMEYLWPTILSFAHELEPGFFENSPQYKIHIGAQKPK